MENSQSIYKNGDGGYVFISHSHLDIEKVRIIRNTLEDQGFEPLCFYLKCLEDEREIDNLIKREIDCRDIFIYVESENSKKSPWVASEREYIKDKNNKTIYKIVLDENTDLKQETLKILNRARVYISYSRRQEYEVKQIKEALKKVDLKVFGVNDYAPGRDFKTEIQRQIEEACKYGCFLLLISKESLDSPLIQQEILIAHNSLKKSGREDCFLTIILDDESALPKNEIFYSAYMTKQAILCQNKPLGNNDLKRIVDLVKFTLKNKTV